MKTALLFLFVSLFLQRLSSQELANTDLDSIQIIRDAEETWRLHMIRDPARMAWLAKESKTPNTDDYRYRKEGKSLRWRAVARNLLATYYDGYELSDFSVAFSAPDEAVLTFRAVVAARGWGKRRILNDYIQTKLRKTNGLWITKEVTFRPAR